MKLRILNIIMAIALLVGAVMTSGCTANDPTPPNRDVLLEESLDKTFRETIVKYNESDNYEANYSAVDYTVLAVNENINTVTIYAVVMYREYNSADGKLTVEYETHLPITVVFQKYDADYALVSYTTPTGNEKYPEGFPESLKGDADPKAYEEKHAGNCLALAKQYFKMTDEEPRYTATVEKFGFREPTKAFETAVYTTKNACLHIIDSIEGIHDYLTLFNPHMDSHTASFLEQKEAWLIERYSEKFFEDNALMIAYVIATSGGDRFAVESIYNDGESFVINVVQVVGGVTCDMAGWLVVVPVPKKDIESCTDISIILSNVRDHSETYKPEKRQEGKTIKFRLFVPESPVGERNFDLTAPSIFTHGSFEIKDGYLYLYAQRGYTYVFKDLDGNRYAYDASKSNADWGGAEITDGEVFELTSTS